jgi:hypothetical protein
LHNTSIGKGVLFVQAEHDASMFQYTGKVDTLVTLL